MRMRPPYRIYTSMVTNRNDVVPISERTLIGLTILPSQFYYIFLTMDHLANLWTSRIWITMKNETSTDSGHLRVNTKFSRSHLKDSQP